MQTVLHELEIFHNQSRGKNVPNTICNAYG